jgi:hypothetical protein
LNSRNGPRHVLGRLSQMMRLQFVRNYLFIFDSNDGRDREVTGQIELSDDDEAFAFGEQVIREMLQGSSRQYKGCAMEVHEGGRIVGRIPLGNYRKPLSPWLLGVAIWQRRSAAVRNCRGMIWTLLSSKRRDLDARSRSLTQGGDREADRSRFSTRAHRIDEGSS